MIQTLPYEILQQRIAQLEEENKKLKLQLDNNKYNQSFLVEFSEGFATYKVGEDFFNSLVEYIAKQTGMDYVFLGELVEPAPGEFAIKTFALAAFGQITGNIQYALPNGPCEQVIRGTLYAYPQQCRQTFPLNQTLVQFNVEGYLGYPLFDVAGNPFGLIAVMHEKEIKEAEHISALLKIVAKRAEFEFERLKHERELTLINKSLETKNIELQRRNSELASFSYIASHDLQEPLRKIEAFSSRILDKDADKLSETGKDYFNRMQKASARAKDLINDLLLYSQTNTYERHFKSVDLNLLMQKTLTDINELINEKKAVVEVGQLPTLNVIEFQFRQLFTNLISNSIKFSKPDVAPKIKISAEEVTTDQLPYTVENNDKWVRINFSDNGIGFDEQYAEKIFSIFQRLHNKEEYPGTGIGLTICRKIAENHGGFITASGKDNEGATFAIYLPTKSKN